MRKLTKNPHSPGGRDTKSGNFSQTINVKYKNKWNILHIKRKLYLFAENVAKKGGRVENIK